jgi:hypothetical protein
MAKKWLVITLLILLSAIMVSCDKESDDSGMVEPQGYMSALINGRSFYTTNVYIPYSWADGRKIDIGGNGNNDDIILMPPASLGTHNIGMQESVQAGYYDKINTTHFYWSAGYSTDGTTGGQITITELERNKKVVGSFSFTVKINGNLISITNGSFSIRNVPKNKSRYLIDS